MEKVLVGQAAGYVGLVVVMCMNVLGNLMMKAGADGDRNFLGLWSWQSLLGIALFAVGVLIYSWVLRWITLHDAQILGTLQYVGVILASAFILGERIVPEKWIGIGLIAVGIAICFRAAPEL